MSYPEMPAEMVASLNAMTDEHIRIVNEEIVPHIVMPLLGIGLEVGYLTENTVHRARAMMVGGAQAAGRLGHPEIEAGMALLCMTYAQNPITILALTKLVRKDGKVVVETNCPPMEELMARGAVVERVSSEGGIGSDVAAMLRRIGIDLDEDGNEEERPTIN